jgi:ATP-dependent RNA helicase RhlE
MFVDAADKKAALLALLRTPGIGQAVVFTLQKNIANEVCAFITEAGVTAEALHGNKSQGQRERALDAFRAGPCRSWWRRISRRAASTSIP